MKRIFKNGDGVRLIKNSGMLAKVRATAVVTNETDMFLYVKWVRDKYSLSQMDGDYHKEYFVLDKITNWRERIK